MIYDLRIFLKIVWIKVKSTPNSKWLRNGFEILYNTPNQNHQKIR